MTAHHEVAYQGTVEKGAGLRDVEMFLVVEGVLLMVEIVRVSQYGEKLLMGGDVRLRDQPFCLIPELRFAAPSWYCLHVIHGQQLFTVQI